MNHEYYINSAKNINLNVKNLTILFFIKKKIHMNQVNA